MFYIILFIVFFMKVLKEIVERVSVNNFLDVEVEKEKIDALIEAARLTPSSFNNQPWNYSFVSKGDELRKDLERCLNLTNGWAKKASHLVVVFSKAEDDKPYNGIPYHIYDSGLSVMSLVLEVEHQGLRAHQMAGFDGEKIKEVLGISENYDVVVLIAVGYEDKDPGFFESLSSDVKEKILSQRKRKDVKDFVWFGQVGK